MIIARISGGSVLSALSIVSAYSQPSGVLKLHSPLGLFDK